MNGETILAVALCLIAFFLIALVWFVVQKRFIPAILATFVFTALTTTGIHIYLNDQEEYGENTIPLAMYSNVLGEEREMIVHLPEGYRNHLDQRYPVVYVLDGSSEDVHTASSAALMARIGVMPQVIVVGLPNTSGVNRQRDYTPLFMRQDIDEADSPFGAGDRFLAFLRVEAIPRIDREYRTNSFRMLAGNSRGGLLVIYSLIADPGMFQARFAHSPALWRYDEIVVSKLQDFFSAHKDKETFLYMSMGSAENEMMKNAYRHTVAVLEGHAPPGS
ncbi:MAG: alpha/beta hydrolase [candidate division Zixibacteria bacterium]|nr:alpha/beta hydrolase [candidate division Zixibacteria bacterium]